MLKKQIDKYDVISFDIFDTAILRYVSRPQDIFKLIEKAYSLDDFTTKRRQVELELRQEFSQKEITIEQIYEKLGQLYNRDELMKIEIELEKRLTTVNPTIFDVYQKALNQNKKVIFTSDMYLPYEVIEEILNSNGYTQYDQLFVSSSYETSKHLGGLYQKVKEHYPNCKIIHFGDNLYSDIIMARKNGITPYYVKKEKIKSSENIEKFISKVTNSSNGWETFWEKIGFEKIGLAYYGFVRWIISELNKQQPDKVLFLSRDGFIMHQLYQKMSNKYPNQYVYVSRKALSFPLLKSAREMVDYYLGYDVITYQNFFDIISLDLNEYELKLKQFEIDTSALILNHVAREKLVLFLESIWKDINQLQEEQHKRILKYIRQSVGYAKNLAIVDLGWKGTIQNFIEQYLNEIDSDIQVKGYYLGIGTKNPRMKQEYQCYLFDKGELVADHAKLKYGATIIEYFFSAPHGTVRGYSKDLGPMLKQDKRLEEQFQNLKLIHKGALKFIEAILPYEDLLQLYELSPQKATELMFNIISNPTQEEVKHLSALYHSDTVDDVVLKKIVDSAKIKNYFNKGKIKEAINQIYWPTGYVSQFRTGFLLKPVVAVFIKIYTYISHQREVAK